MYYQSLGLIALVVAVSAQVQLGNNANDPSRALVLMASTSPYDPYYGQYYNDITQFQINFAQRVSQAGDNVIVLATPEAASRFRAVLAADQVVVEPQVDIWIRDFSVVRMNKPTALILQNQYHSNSLAANIQNTFLNTVKKYCPSSNIRSSEVGGDGGNIVDNFVDTAVLTRRTVVDNAPSTEHQIRQQLLNDLDYKRVIFIPDSVDKLGHADGMVGWIDNNQLAITSTLRDQPNIWSATLQDLYKQAPDLYNTIVEVNSTYRDQVFDNFDSACGLHINALLTGKNLYVPTFGQDPTNQLYGQSIQKDQTVIQSIRARTRKQVVEVPVPNTVCRMGGSVRCLSTAIQGSLADCLVRQVQTRVGSQNNGFNGGK